ncbi:Initiator Replication protein, partial [Desulfacinum hydrothermale DSM 13146]
AKKLIHMLTRGRPRSVKMSNAIARGSYDACSYLEPRIVALLAAQVHSSEKQLRDYVLSVEDILGGKPEGGKNIQILEAIVDRLISKIVRIKRPEGWVAYAFFSAVAYDSKQKTLTISLHPDMQKYFLNLRKHFTLFNLWEFLQLNTVYSQKLFLFLKSWESEESIEISLDELYEIMEIPASFRTNFSIFRTKALEKAQKEIEQKTQLRFAWQPLRQGRKVVAIRFLHQQKNLEHSNSTETSNPNSGIIPNPLRHLINLVPENQKSEATAVITSALRNGTDINTVRNAILYANKHAKSNYSAYLNKAIANQWSLPESSHPEMYTEPQFTSHEELLQKFSSARYLRSGRQTAEIYNECCNIYGRMLFKEDIVDMVMTGKAVLLDDNMQKL